VHNFIAHFSCYVGFTSWSWVKLRPTASRPVCLGVRRRSATRDQFYFLLEIFFRHLLVCYFVAPSLTRGRVCNLLVQLLLGLASAVTLGSKSRRTHGHILLSHLRLPQPGGPGSLIYIPRNRVAQLYPRALGSLFVASYDSQGLRWRHSNPPPHGFRIYKVRSQCLYSCRYTNMGCPMIEVSVLCRIQ
jgi:hypothetical protein